LEIVDQQDFAFVLGERGLGSDLKFVVRREIEFLDDAARQIAAQQD
jgi:hypothetical protein